MDAESEDTGEPGTANVVAVVAVTLGAGALAAAAIPYVGLVAGPFGAAAVALGLVALGEARRRGRRGIAIVATVLGVLAILGSAGWWATTVGFGPVGGGGIAQESAQMEAVEPPAVPSHSDASPAPDVAEVEVPTEITDVEDGTGRATLTVDGETSELELATCTTGGRRSDRHLRGEGPDGRLAVQSATSRVLLVVDTDEQRLVFAGQRRSGRASGPGDEGVDLELAGGMRELLTGDTSDVELEANCS
jgi:hypothetical protein